MKIKVELEFDVNEDYITKYMLAYYLERNSLHLIEYIFDDWNDDDTKTEWGFTPDSECSYKVTNVEEIKD